MEPVAPSMRLQVCLFIEDRENGGTCDEVEVMSGFSHQTVSARIRELAKAGRIKDSGRTRPTSAGRKAVVWIV